MGPHSVLNMADARHVESVEPDGSACGHQKYPSLPHFFYPETRAPRGRERSATAGSAGPNRLESLAACAAPVNLLWLAATTTSSAGSAGLAAPPSFLVR